MRTFLFSLLCLALLTAGQTTAQETFAPLLTENTIAFVHVDFSKLDIDTVKAEAMKIGDIVLTALAFDARSKRATLRDLETELEKLDAMVRPTWETITKELGIQEIAIILDTEIIENLPGKGFLAIPWKNKTDEQIEVLQQLLHGFGPPNPNDYTKAGDFLILAHSETGEMVKGWLTKNATARKDSAFAKVLQSLNKSDEVKAVVMIQKILNHPELREEMQLDEFPEETPEEVKNFILAATKIEWVAVALPIPEIYAKTVENARRLVTIKLPSAGDAKTLRELMETALDAWTTAAAEGFQMGAGFALPPLASEFYKGYLRTMFPDVEGDTLIFRMKHLRQYTKLSLFPL